MKVNLHKKFVLLLVSLNLWASITAQVTTFAYTGAVQTYTVPPGVTSIQIETWGAQGQATTIEAHVPSTGGLGGYAIGFLAVVPGQVLNVYVGGTGLAGVASFNGGAVGGYGTPSDGMAGYGGSGGGASDVRVSPYTLASRRIVGGGGGGGGRDYWNGFCVPCGTGGNGGAGGALIGLDGADPWYVIGPYTNPGSRGKGGTQVAGGLGGNGPEGVDGNPGVLGVGGVGIPGNFSVGSGGGGGGYYGGGSGASANWGSGVAGGGGAGGSSYIGGVTGGSTTAGIRSGNGQVVITVLCDPMTVVVSDYEICAGETITLDATAASGLPVTWDLGVVDGVPFTPGGVGVITYTASTVGVDDCELEVDIEINPLPTVTLTVDATEICLGDSVTFTSGGTATTYSWAPVAIVSGTPYTPPAAGTVTYILTGTITATGCENTDEVDVTVHPLPVVTATASETSICLGESVTFTGGGADTYVWDPLAVTDGVAYTPASVGTVTYTVIGTNTATGCENTASVDVTVNAAPTVTASATETEVCLGETIILTGSGAATYTWDLGVTNGVAFAPPVGTTTYTVTGSTLSGCEGTASIDITVNPLPVVTASADDTEICSGDEITLTGSGASTYTWDLGVTDGDPFAPAGLGTITYTVTGTSVDGCEGIATIDILVEASPIVTATASETDICEGESIILTGGGADTYTWSPGGIDGVPYTPASDGTIVFTVTGTTSGSGCSSSDDVTVVVHPDPTVTASATTTEVCFGESVTLTGGGASTYTWTGGITNGVAFTPGAIGVTTYTVTGTTVFGCVSTSSITISVIDCEPVVPVFNLPSPVCVGDCITITDLSTGAVASWEWDFGGAASPSTSTEQNPEICLTTSGTYTVELTTTSSTGAISSVSNPITVNNNPVLTAATDTIIDLGGTATLVASPSGTGDYLWTPNKNMDCEDCPMATASPEESTTYTVIYTDQNGCRASDTVMVLVNFVEGVGVPTAFSPNGDGNNDVLFVRGYAIEAISFTVYNRYGEVVFETTDQNIGWDGMFKGKEENPGVFTWNLYYEFVNGESGTQKGNTTLIR
jgi:gliding motility-associated-like protein